MTSETYAQSSRAGSAASTKGQEGPGLEDHIADLEALRDRLDKEISAHGCVQSIAQGTA
jgi:hypothetical protein